MSETHAERLRKLRAPKGDTDPPRCSRCADTKYPCEVNEVATEAATELDRLAGEVDRWMQEHYGECKKNERLEAIVAKLPKTADGVPVAMGDSVWFDDVDSPDRWCRDVVGGVWNEKYTHKGAVGDWVLTGDRMEDLAKNCYSTQAAALAAKDGGGG